MITNISTLKNEIQTPDPAETAQLKAILGMLAGKVYDKLGPGLSEAVYRRALDIELRYMGIDVECAVEEPVYYDGYWIGKRKVDLLFGKSILVVIKSAYSVDQSDLMAMQSHLKTFEVPLGILINFGKEKPEFAEFSLADGEMDK
ncbi:MAG TPA: GxxExxY protein [Parasegetibacter sp.]